MASSSLIAQLHQIQSAHTSQTYIQTCLAQVIMAQSVFVFTAFVSWRQMWKTTPRVDHESQGGLSIRKQLNSQILTSHFHKNVKATTDLAPKLQLPRWCYIEPEVVIWERNGVVEAPNLRRFFLSDCKKKLGNLHNFLIERLPQFDFICLSWLVGRGLGEK